MSVVPPLFPPFLSLPSSPFSLPLSSLSLSPLSHNLCGWDMFPMLWKRGPLVSSAMNLPMSLCFNRPKFQLTLSFREVVTCPKSHFSKPGGPCP